MTSQCLATDYNRASSTTLGQTKSRSILHRLFTAWLKHRQQKLDRFALKELSSLDDAMLKDIGISRSDVVWASQLPSSVNASVELEIIARRRSA